MYRVYLIIVSFLFFLPVKAQDDIEFIKDLKFCVQIEACPLFLYKYGEFLPPDSLEKLANSGEEVAKYELGHYYLLKKEIPHNGERAIFWLQQALEKNIDLAYADIGYCYEKGIGVEKNEFQAYSFYKKKAVKGNSGAALNLAYCYLNGIGTEPDTLKSLAWFEKIAENYDSDNLAGFWTGYIYYLNNNYDKAVYWLTKTSTSNANSANLLAYMTENGIGVRKDEVKAKELYRRAYKLGDKSVKDKIE